MFEQRGSVNAMTRRTLWTVVFLALTAAPIGMELYAAAQPSQDRPTWTELITTWWPAPVTLGLVGLLTAWIGPHFRAAYRLRSSVTAKSPTWWLQADGANRAWRTVLQGIVATALGAAGDVVLQAIRDAALSGAGIDLGQVGTTAGYAAGTSLLVAVLAYLHRVKIDPSAVPSAQPPDPLPAASPQSAAVPRAG